MEFLTTHRTIQSTGLDDVGHPPGEGAPILAEVVQARAEELYWAKVPEKIRKAAVQKAMQGGTDTPVNEAGEKRKRKR